jgi:translocation and assembly module TamA
LLFGCPSVCTLSYLEERLVWDHRDQRLEPRDGYYLALSLQEGGGPLGGSFDYVRVEPEARAYYSLDSAKRYTLAARVRVGTLQPLSGPDLSSPIVARFFSGGDGMRGFNARRLSPMYIEPNPNPADPHTGLAEPIGGNGLFESSVEARWNAVGGLVFALFADGGFVTSEHFDFGYARYLSSHMLYAVGLGTRYQTPVGPLRLDLAYRPNVGPPLEVTSPAALLNYYSPRGCFGIGGKEGTRAGSPEDPCTLQLSIGEAF